MARTVDNFFEGAGAPAVKFPTVGTTVTGVISGELEMRQRNDIITGEPQTWPDGNPKMQMIVPLQTDLRDPEIPDDDGMRRLFIPDPGGLKAAIGKALKDAGVKGGLEQGATLTVTFSSETPPKQKGLNPAKNYVATYTRPSDTFFNGHSVTGGTAEVSQETLPKGMTPEVWAGLSDDVKKGLLEAAKP
jgi:hypothetical protein